MGYCIQLNESNFILKLADKASALKAIKRTLKRADYAWVESEFRKAKTLEEALEAWRYDVTLNDEGDIVGLDFTGEKLGDDQKLFETIAPFVQNGSYLEMSGEDGGVWRWVFSDGKMTENTPTW